MKTILLSLTFTLLSMSLFSQDNIVLTDGSRIKSKIMAIMQDEVVYKKYENLEGPDYYISINAVEKIIYENGYIENLKTTKNYQSSKPAQSRGNNINYGEISYYPKGKAKEKFFINDIYLSRGEAGKYLKVNTEANHYYERAMRYYSLEIVSQVIGGIAFFGGGIVGGLLKNVPIIISAATVTAIFWYVDIKATQKERANMVDAVNAYNNGLPYSSSAEQQDTYFSFGLNQHGIGVSIHF